MRKKYLFVFVIILVFIIGLYTGILISIRKDRDKHVEELFRHGKLLLLQNKYEDALLTFKLIHITYPQHNLSIQSLYEVGKIQEYYFKNIPEATKVYKKVMKYENTPLKNRCLRKINIYKSTGHNFYKNIVHKFPNVDDFSIPYNEKNYVVHDIDLLLHDFPNFKKLDLIFVKGKILKENKDIKNAIKQFEYLLKQKPDEDKKSLYYLEISDCLYKNKDFEKALRYVGKITSPKYKDFVHLGEGDILFSLKKYSEATEAYKKVSDDFLPAEDMKYFSGEKKETQLTKALFELGNNYLNSKKIKDAILAYQTILDLYPQSHLKLDVLFQIGLCREARGEKITPQYYEDILANAENADTLIKAYYKFINKSQEDLYFAGLPLYTLYNEEYNIAQKYGEKVISSIKKEKNKSLYSLVLCDIYSFLLDFKKVEEEKKHILSAKNILPFSTVQTKIYKGNDPSSNLEYLANKSNLYREIMDLKNKKKKQPIDFLNMVGLYQALGLFDEADKIYQEIKSKDKKFVEKFYKLNISNIINDVDKKNDTLIMLCKNFIDGKEINKKFLDLYYFDVENVLISLIVGLREYINPQLYKYEREIKFHNRELNLDVVLPPDKESKKKQMHLAEKLAKILWQCNEFRENPDKNNALKLLEELQDFKSNFFEKAI